MMTLLELVVILLAGFRLFLQGVEETAWYTAASPEDTKAGGGLSVIKNSDTELSAVFGSGTYREFLSGISHL